MHFAGRYRRRGGATVVRALQRSNDLHRQLQQQLVEGRGQENDTNIKTFGPWRCGGMHHSRPRKVFPVRVETGRTTRNGDSDPSTSTIVFIRFSSKFLHSIASERGRGAADVQKTKPRHRLKSDPLINIRSRVRCAPFKGADAEFGRNACVNRRDGNLKSRKPVEERSRARAARARPQSRDEFSSAVTKSIRR